MPSTACGHILANPRTAHLFSRIGEFVHPEKVYVRSLISVIRAVNAAIAKPG